MKLLHAIKWIQDALSTKDLVPSLSHYLLLPSGHALASDGRLLACHPCDYAGPDAILVPGNSLERALKTLGEDADITLHRVGTGAVLKCGKLRIRYVTADQIHWQAVRSLPANVETLPWTEGLQVATRVLAPFVGTNATKMWTTGLGFLGRYVYATNNVVLARLPVSEEPDASTGVPEGTVLPGWGVEFLTNHAAPDAFAYQDGAWWFVWDSLGAWVRATGLVDSFPPTAARLLDTLAEGYVDPSTVPWHMIDVPWSIVFRRVAALTPATEAIELHTDHIVGGSAEAYVRDEAATPAPDTGPSLWNPGFLEIVVNAATRWTPHAYPKPAYFQGPHSLEGAMQGIVVAPRVAPQLETEDTHGE